MFEEVHSLCKFNFRLDCSAIELDFEMYSR